MVLPYLIFKISSAEQSRKAHSFANVVSDGIIRPERYCETVGFDTPIAFAISLFDFPDSSISSFSRLLMRSSKSIILHQLIFNMMVTLLGTT